MMARLQGERAPTCRLAAFRKLEALRLGPEGDTVRLNVTEYPLIDAVTLAWPVVAPAVTLMEACPLEVVVTAALEMVTGPVLEKLTTTPETGPLALFTCTTNGAVNAALMTAVCGLPPTIEMPVTVGPVGADVTVRVKV